MRDRPEAHAMYKLQPRTRMSYAWDYPAAREKKIYLSSNGHARKIDIMEIGNLPPLKVNTSIYPHMCIVLNILGIFDSFNKAHVRFLWTSALMVLHNCSPLQTTGRKQVFTSSSGVTPGRHHARTRFQVLMTSKLSNKKSRRVSS